MSSQEERLTEQAAPQARPSRKSAQAPVAPARAPRRPVQAARNAMDEDRGLEEHEAEDSVYSSYEEEDRALALFLDSMQDSVLPDLPAIPGYHVCWLTTQNPRDPIARRLSAGYKLITVTEFPHLDGSSMKTGDYAGVVGINEMVAAKIPERAYQRAMGVLHHQRPNDEEAKIRSRVDSIKENAAREGAPILEVGDGTADLGKGAPVPTFA